MNLRAVRSHISTVHKHRKAVRQHMFKLGPKFYIRGLTHDLSKYSPQEFIPAVKYYTGTASPHIGERKAHGYSSAWLHHKSHNKHHYQYWFDTSESSVDDIPVIMPAKYFCELICDRIAASKVYSGDKYTDASPYEYYLRATKKSKGIHKVVKKALEKCMIYLKDNGEEKFFKELKLVYDRFGNKGTLMYSMINFDDSSYFK